MSFTKTAALVALSSTLAFAGTAMADHSNAKDNDLKMGMSINFMEGIADSFGVGFDLKNNRFEAGLGAYAGRYHDVSSNTDFTLYDLNAYFGFRTALHSNIWGSLGLLAEYAMTSNTLSTSNYTVSERNPFNLGPYLGLSYEPTPSLEIFARVSPVAYSQDEEGDDIYSFFSMGQIGVAYFF